MEASASKGSNFKKKKRIYFLNAFPHKGKNCTKFHGTDIKPMFSLYRNDIGFNPKRFRRIKHRNHSYCNPEQWPFVNLGIGIGFRTDITNAIISTSVWPTDPNLTWWLLRMNVPYPSSHVTLWYCGHVTNKKGYNSTFTRPMDPERSSGNLGLGDPTNQVTWHTDHVFTWQVKSVISSDSQCSCSPKLGMVLT